RARGGARAPRARATSRPRAGGRPAAARGRIATRGVRRGARSRLLRAPQGALGSLLRSGCGAAISWGGGTLDLRSLLLVRKRAGVKRESCGGDRTVSGISRALSNRFQNLSWRTQRRRRVDAGRLLGRKEAGEEGDGAQERGGQGEVERVVALDLEQLAGER